MPDFPPDIPVIDVPYDAFQEGYAILRLVPVPPIISPPAPIVLPPRIGLGLDVSRHQGVIDWDKLAQANPAFVAIRATLGITGLDTQFKRNWAEAKRVGIPRQAYHYHIAGTKGVTQADWFSSNLEGDRGELPPVWDVEPRKVGEGYETIDQRAYTKELGLALFHLEEWLDGRTQPILYTNGWAWNYCTGGEDFSAFPLWVAGYNEIGPSLFGQWNKWHTWQYSAGGRVLGIAGNVDMNARGGLPPKWAFLSGKRRKPILQNFPVCDKPHGKEINVLRNVTWECLISRITLDGWIQISATPDYWVSASVFV